MRYLLVDGMNLLFRSGHSAGHLTDGDGNATGTTYGFLRGMFAAYKSVLGDSGGKVIIAWDGGRSSRRTSVYPEYKANRSAKKLEDMSDAERRRYDEKQLMLSQLPEIQYLTSCLGAYQCHREGVEADDIIANIAYSLQEKNDVIIFSNDEDFRQCVRGRISLLNAKGEIIRAGSVVPENEILIKALSGCSSDNISGYPKIGDATAKTFVQFVCEEFKIPFATVEKIEEVIEKTEFNIAPRGRVKTALSSISYTGTDVLKRNIQLVDLINLPLTWREVWEAVNAAERNKNFNAAMEEIENLGFKSLLKDSQLIDNFYNNSPVLFNQ